MDQFVLTTQETGILKDFIPDFKIDLFDLKKVELKEKLESITFQVTLGVVQRIREGDLDFLSHLPGLFSLLLEIEEESKRELNKELRKRNWKPPVRCLGKEWI